MPELNIGKVRPLGKYVLLKTFRVERVGEMGLIEVPPMFQEYPLEAEVVAVGNEVQSIKKGERVVYSIWATKPLKYHEDYVLIHENEILAKVIRD